MLTKKELKKIQKDNETITFEKDTDIVYERHHPPGGIALLEGEIEFLRKNRLENRVYPKYLIGAVNLRNNKRSQYLVRIKAGSRIILLGKSDLEKYGYFEKEGNETSE